MIIGRRLELYKYNNDSRNDEEMSPYTKGNWCFDLKDTNLSVVNQYLHSMIMSPIIYQNGVNGEGPNGGQ
jgi:hypothetical protein